MQSAARDAAWNEAVAGEGLRRINAAPDAEAGLRQLLAYLGQALQCDRVYVFEEMDRQHIRNTYEWCAEGVPSGIEQLPYVVKRDLAPWYARLAAGESVVQPEVAALLPADPLLYDFLHAQQIRSIVLSPMLAQGRMVGLLGADNPPPEALHNISVLFAVLAQFVCSLVSQRELSRLRGAREEAAEAAEAAHTGRTVLLVDDSRELLDLNRRVLQADGYDVLCAGSLREARAVLARAAPDAVVLDVDLPDGGGIDFCRELRQRGAAVPVVFLSARSDAQTARRGTVAGGCAFLTKPYRLEELQSAVADACDAPPRAAGG